MADHFAEFRLSRFVGQRAVTRNRDRRHSAGVNDPFDSNTLRRGKQLARAFYIAFVDFFGMSGPQPVISGYMKNATDAAHGAFDRSRVAQIALGSFHRQVGKNVRIASFSTEDTDCMSLVNEQPGDVASHEPCGSGNERGHKMRKTSSPCCAGATGITRFGMLLFPEPFPWPFEWPLPWPLFFFSRSVGSPRRPPIFPETVQLSIFHVSPSFLLPPRIAAATVFFPGRLLDEVFEIVVMRVGHQVTGAFPTARIVSGIAPGGAHQLALAAEIFHVDGRSDDVVALEQLVSLAELLANFIARHEDFLGHYRSVGIGRRKHVAIDAECLEISEKIGNLFDVRLFVNRGVGGDEKTRSLGCLDAFDCFAEHAVALNADIVSLFEPIEVDVEEQARSGREIAEMLANKHTIGAKVDVFLARKDFVSQAANLGINHRLAAANGNDGRAAIVNRLQALLDGKHFVDRGFVFANAAAASAGEIAGVERFEHHHQRKFLRPSDALASEITRHARSEAKRNSHPLPPSLIRCFISSAGICKANDLRRPLRMLSKRASAYSGNEFR